MGAMAKKASVWQRRDGGAMGCHSLLLCVGVFVLFFLINRFEINRGRIFFRLVANGYRLCVVRDCVEANVSAVTKPASGN